jgi:hypothetical protein
MRIFSQARGGDESHPDVLFSMKSKEDEYVYPVVLDGHFFKRSGQSINMTSGLAPSHGSSPGIVSSLVGSVVDGYDWRMFGISDTGDCSSSHNPTSTWVNPLGDATAHDTWP